LEETQREIKTRKKGSSNLQVERREKCEGGVRKQRVYGVLCRKRNWKKKRRGKKAWEKRNWRFRVEQGGNAKNVLNLVRSLGEGVEKLFKKNSTRGEKVRKKKDLLKCGWGGGGERERGFNRGR